MGLRRAVGLRAGRSGRRRGAAAGRAWRVLLEAVEDGFVGVGVGCAVEMDFLREFFWRVKVWFGLCWREPYHHLFDTGYLRLFPVGNRHLIKISLGWNR